MEQLVKKKEIVSAFLRSNVLVSRQVLDRLSHPDVVDQWHAALEKGAHPSDLISAKGFPIPSVRILWEYDDRPKKRTVQDFVDYFNARYRALARLLHNRQELQNLTSIGRLRGKRDREQVSIIGIVFDKRQTKNDHWMLTLEDTTGTINVLVSKSKPDQAIAASDIVLDEVIGVRGVMGENMVFADALVIPDVPIFEQKRTPDEVYAAVLSCIHVGSARFEKEKFENFLRWVNGEYGTPEQKAIASKLKYIFICGDVVDGVGIYPQQEKELSITDVRAQYSECARLLSKIRRDVHLIIGPGNHDVGRISEPQPKLMKEYARPLWELPNVTMVCNPCVTNIHASADFEGIDVLTYHGYSFDDYGEIVPSIKNSGKHISDRAPLIMRFLLQRRHLAPQHTSTLYIPDARADPLVIEKVPDLFFAGHIHKAGAMQYRGVTLVSASCFQGKTDFQEKVGHDPEPGVVPVVNLQTRQVHMLRF
ncbi:MAG: metallophosphoesterase [Candidatus Woesearchaeota archaeon]